MRVARRRTAAAPRGRHAFAREVRALLALALPIVGTQLAHTGMGVVDTLMAGRLSPVALAAVAVGSSVWLPVYLAISGVLLALSTFVSRFHGAGDAERILAYVHRALGLGLVLGGLGWLALRSAGPVFAWMEVAPSIRGPGLGYLAAVSWGLPGFALFQVLRSYCEGLHRTAPVMSVSVLGLLVNIPANYVFIYGKLGLPALGAVGCGWATSLVMWLMAGAMAVYAVRLAGGPGALLRPARRTAPGAARELLRVGLPIGGAIFVEVTLFTVIALLIASLGAEVVAAHQIALNAAGLAFMVPLSLAMAITIRVGHALGRGRARAARFAAWSGMAVTAGWSLLASLGMAFGAAAIVRLYTPDPAVQRLAVQLLLWAALFQFSDAVQVSAAGALRAYKDTLVVFVVTLVSFWAVGLTSGYVLGLGDLFGAPRGPQGFWIGLVLGLTTAAVLLAARLAGVSRAASRAAGQR